MIRASPRTPQEMPLIFHLFSIEGGARHPWQLSAMATAIATWLSALSRSHSTRAHHMGGANSGEIRKQHKGKEKVVRARGKRMHRARTAWCTARTARACPTEAHLTEQLVGSPASGKVRGGGGAAARRPQPGGSPG